MKQTTHPSPMIAIDPYLAPYAQALALRRRRYLDTRKRLLGTHGKLVDFANGALYYGFHRTETGWVYREWAPHAQALHLFGSFNGWDRKRHPLTRGDNGDWSIELAGERALRHLDEVLVCVQADGTSQDRIPLYIRRVKQNPETKGFVGQIWAPDKPFVWTDARFRPGRCKPLCIYECHIGMAQEEPRIGTYLEFAKHILPRVKAGGYNAVQLMAVMEHPYYASFGYQVSNFFAASAWFGTPDELKALVNTAHEMGIAVLLDVVHSHAAANTAEGIAGFDGDDTQFFHAGARGEHTAWGSRVFDYGKPGVLHFLLSNVKFWMTEYHFDGFRFDGVTSMLYTDHGLGRAFTQYGDYFGEGTDIDALTYLTLANELVHAVKRSAITVAEDMSGMPGMCLPIRAGGVGFDYRLSMGVPDFWIRQLKDGTDDTLDIHRMWHELTTRRPQEKNIGYSESHDQALVGDKTLMFWLADSAMYDQMDKACRTLVIDRAIALIKLIRFITLALAGEGYLNFMGNEFGHPEWVDFPRAGNGWSYQYARRQWSLADNGYLKYAWLGAFDRAMLAFVQEHGVLGAQDLANLWVDMPRKLLAFRKAGLIFLFNFHPTVSQADFFLPVGREGTYRVVFSTDDAAFGGDARIDQAYCYEAVSVQGMGYGFPIYTPCRTAMVLARVGGEERK